MSIYHYHLTPQSAYDIFGQVVPSRVLNQADKEKAQGTIDVLNLNCLRLKRQRESVIEEGYEIINELMGDQDALKNFLDLELNAVNGKYFSFINLRREHFSGFDSAV